MTNKKLEILAIIPARGGSKRVPGKNIRLLGDSPLIVWSINVVQGIPEISDTLVSTDDPEIEEIAKKSGALVPWLRPSEFIEVTGSGLDRLSNIFEQYAIENIEDINEQKITKYKNAPYRAPMVIVLISNIKKHDKNVLKHDTHYLDKPALQML